MKLLRFIVVCAVALAAGSGVSAAAVTTCGGLTATIVGTSGNDALTGTSGNDVIAGLDGNDTIIGSGGNDVMCGGPGDDSIDGGLGTDTVSYLESATAVKVDLTAGTATGEGTDTLTTVENADGSAKPDKLTGDSAANVISGAGGGDTVDGAGGNDTLNGGAGSDTASFASSTAAITANLATGTATGNGTVTLNAFENLLGSAQNDALTGDSKANTIDGGAGNDTMDGSGGVNIASFKSATKAITANLTTGAATGNGTDTLTNFQNLTGGKKNDKLTGDGGVNVLDGSGGTDTCDLTAAGADTGVNCEIVTATIDVAGTTDTFNYTKSAGDKLFLQTVQTADNGRCSNLQWMMVGPGSTTVLPTGAVCSNHGPLVLATTGTYALTVFSNPGGPTGTGTYAFRMWDVPAPQVFAYTLGTTVSDGVPTAGQGNIESPQAEDDYTFSGTAGQKIFYNTISVGGGQCNSHRNILTPSNTVVAGTEGFVCQNLGPITLPSTGTYTVRVYEAANEPYTGIYSFKITNVPAPQTFAYTIGNTVSNGVPAAGAGNIETFGAEDDYTFSGTAGQQITYNAISVAGGNCNSHRTIYTPSATVLTGADGYVCQTTASITLPATGTYTVKVYEVANEPYTGIYSFKITSP